MGATDAPTLGIIAGTGRLPAQLIETCQSTGRRFFVLAFEGSADLAMIGDVPHAVVRIGAIGEALDHLRRAEVREVVMAGSVKRPSLLSLRPDKVGAKLLARLGGAFFSGDDALLTSLIAFLEEEGFRVVGSEDVLATLIAPHGVMGKITPGPKDEADIAHGLKAAKMLGALDIGQAVIVENGYVLGVEAAEGTDALIERCAAFKHLPKGGVLVKIRKPAQEGRVDLPTIGVATVERASRCGLAGIAIEAGGGIILDKEAVIAHADEAGLFITGIVHDG